MMRFVDILYAIPFTVFVIVLMVAFGRTFLLLFVAIGAPHLAQRVHALIVGLPIRLYDIPNPQLKEELA